VTIALLLLLRNLATVLSGRINARPAPACRP